MTAFPRALAVSLFIAGLAGCGGNTIGEDAAPPPPTADTELLLPYATAAGDLKLLDPASPDTVPASADTGLSVADAGAATRIVAGTYDSATNDLSDLHFRHLVYVKNGALYRVDLLKGADSTPVRVSSVADACYVEVDAVDYAEPLDSWLRIRRRGPDAQCETSDDVASFARPSFASGTAVVEPATPFIIAATTHASDGSIASLLVQDGDASSPALRRYAADLGSSVLVSQLAANSSVEAGVAPSRTRRYLRMKRSSDGNHKLYRYDAANDTLASIHEYASTSTDTLRFASAGDDLHLYFADAHTLNRVAHDSGSAVALHTATVGMTFPSLERTNTRIVVIRWNGAQSGLYSLPQDGGTTLTTLEADSVADIDIEAVAGAMVYYSLDDTIAVLNNETGTARGAGAGTWGGFLFNTRGDAGGLNENQAFSMLVLQRAADDVFAAVTASTGSVARLLGSSASSVGSFGYNIGRYVLLNVDLGASDDVYFADVLTASSLRGVATTAGQDDAAP